MRLGVVELTQHLLCRSFLCASRVVAQLALVLCVEPVFLYKNVFGTVQFLKAFNVTVGGGDAFGVASE